jgi:hypothetical protein
MVSHEQIAMNLSHGDHTAAPIGKGDVVTAAFESHDSGTPRTIFAKCWECDSYSFRTSDVFGANSSAE